MGARTFSVVPSVKHSQGDGDHFGLINNNMYCGVFGYVTESGTQLVLFIPVSIWTDTSFTLTSVDNLLLRIRTPSGGYLVSSGYNATSLVTDKQLRSGGRGFYIVVTKSDGWGVANNSVITGEVTIAVTF